MDLLDTHLETMDVIEIHETGHIKIWDAQGSPHTSHGTEMIPMGFAVTSNEAMKIAEGIAISHGTRVLSAYENRPAEGVHRFILA